ncbi:dipeptide transport system substrate-binding protein [Inquilinus ginsengisoli]|uniref:Dipeptide transport system substrate-binding protein n=1 Tax=Inquilinus ginsengisoli TaxID=363840 RepID=A0ABU1JNE0_9PROT|nr:ABC transporter substrate-binding protein [Inquilinus ginsengisoli]MDR6290137.1 dipeptide transport system substrate-binding protein [Inquilinus ginsengisoli]
MSMVRRSLVAAALITLAAPGLPAAAKTLVYCSEASPESFNPMFASADSTMDAVARTVYDRLVRFKPGTTEITPSLAERWEISDDGRIYTFHLRPDVKFAANAAFTPTRPLTADDVVYSFDRQWRADNPFHTLGGSSYEYFEALGLGAMLQSIDKVDDLTVRFTLKAPNATFLATIALDFASIQSLEMAQAMVAKGTPEALDQTPVGTGPFVLQAYDPDSRIRYKANPDYWDGKPPIDTLVFDITPDATVRVSKLQAGECQITTQPLASAVPQLKQDPNITVLQRPGDNLGYLGFNLEKKPLGDVRVRRALAMAINRQAIVEAVYQGAGTLVNSALSPVEWGAAKDLKGYAYDPKAAKALLAEAGYPDGFSLSLWAMPVSRPYNPDARRMAELIQADWAAIGVKAEIVSMEWGAYLNRTQAGEHDALLLGGTSDNGDPDNTLTFVLACGEQNRMKWCDKPFNALLDEARSTTDQARRTELYVKAQQIVEDQVPLVPIASSIVSMPIRKNVLNYVLDPFGRQNFSKLDLAE